MKYTIVQKSVLSKLEAELTHLKGEVQNSKTLIEDINSGKLEKEIALNDKEHTLLNDLLMMRDQLILVKKEESERNWSAEGLAKFAEILRKNDESVEDLCYQVISQLVKYLDANQGGIFIVSDHDNDLLQLKGSYAYDRRKYDQREVTKGEGLLGQCYIEKDLIYLTDIPQNYTYITSGLGQTTPRCLLIVPLISAEEAFGVMEIASLTVFKPYQIEFAKKIAENIAATIKNVKVNFKTKQLLASSQELTEQMRSQEEEIRQNMEELQATQEELIRKDTENQQIIADLREEYQAKLEEISKNEQHLLKIKTELVQKMTSNNTLIDIAGRQRMLSQKIGFYAEMVFNKNTSKIDSLQKAINLHQLTIEVMKKGGNASAVGHAENINPAEPKLLTVIEAAEKVWIPFRNAALEIIALATKKTDSAENEILAKTKIKLIEDTGELLLQEHINVLNTCLEINKQKIISTYS